MFTHFEDEMDFYFINSNNSVLKLSFICFSFLIPIFLSFLSILRLLSLFTLMGSCLLSVLYWCTSVWFLSPCASVWIFFHWKFLSYSPVISFFCGIDCAVQSSNKKCLLLWKTSWLISGDPLLLKVSEFGKGEGITTEFFCMSNRWQHSLKDLKLGLCYHVILNAEFY